MKEITKDLQSLRQELIEGVDLQAKIGEHEAHVEQRCADALKGKCIHVLEATHFHCCFSYTEEF